VIEFLPLPRRNLQIDPQNRKNFVAEEALELDGEKIFQKKSS
jgi:hypothetical protein